MNKVMVFLVLVLSVNFFCADKAAEKPGFYSLYAWYSEVPAFADEVAKVGFKWMRLGGPVFDPGEEKGFIEAVKKGINVVPVMGGDKDSDITKMPAYRESIKKYLARYGENGTLWKENPSVKQIPIKYVEIWNEPNIEYLTPTGGKKRDECYAEFLKVSYEEIKRFDPGIKVIGMNTAGGTMKPDGALTAELDFNGLIGWYKFIKGVHKAGGGKYYDILGIHPYTGGKAPEKAGYIKAIENVHADCIANGGGDKPVWVTECGFSLPVTKKDGKGVPAEGVIKNEELQANYLIRQMAISAACGVEQFQIMYISDIGDFYAGLFLRGTKKWRKQTYALKNMMELLPDPVILKKLSEGTEGIYAYVFKGAGDKETIMAWNTGKEDIEKEYEVKGTDFTLSTRDGEKKAIKAAGGKVKVTLSQSPVYIY